MLHDTQSDAVDLHLAPDALRRLLHGDPAPLRPAKAPSNQHVVLTVPAQLRRCGGATKLIVPGRATHPAPARPHAALIKALVRAHAGLAALRAGAPQVAAPDLARILPLAFLAPDITQAILDGTQPPDLTLARLRQPLPLAWPEQRRRLGFPAAGRFHDGLIREPTRRRRRPGPSAGTTLVRAQPRAPTASPRP